jgi:hypothetical protein
MAEKSSWDQASRRQKRGLVWRNRKKTNQIIKDYFYLPLFYASDKIKEGLTSVEDIWVSILASILGLILFMLLLLVLSTPPEAETSDGQIRKLGEGQRRKREGKAAWRPEEERKVNTVR